MASGGIEMERWKTIFAALGLSLCVACGGAQAEPEEPAEEDDSHFPEDAMDEYEGDGPEGDAMTGDPIDDEAVDVTEDDGY